MKWDTLSGLVLRAQRRTGERLIVTIVRTQGRWVVTAQEAPSDVEDVGVPVPVAHKLLGRWTDLPTALRRGEHHANAWGMGCALEPEPA